MAGDESYAPGLSSDVCLRRDAVMNCSSVVMGNLDTETLLTLRLGDRRWVVQQAKTHPDRHQHYLWALLHF